MKVVALRKAKQELSATVAESQEEQVLITKHGRPAAVLIGVDGYDMEEVMLMANSRFWQLIEKSRKKKSRHSLADVRKRFSSGKTRRPRKLQEPRKTD